MRKLILFFFLFELDAQSTPIPDQNSDSLKNEFTLNDILGLWSCRRVEANPNPSFAVTDGNGVEMFFFNQSIYIKGDSLWRCCFPCKVFSGTKIVFVNDSLYEQYSEKPFAFITIYSSGPAIVMMNDYVFIPPDFSRFNEIGDEPSSAVPIKLTRSFVEDRIFERDSFGTFNMQQFIRDTFNYSALVGSMSLTFSYEPGNEDHGILPLKMPAEIIIESEEQAKLICQNKEIYLRINGRKRRFIVEEINWDNDDFSTTNLRVNPDGQKPTENIYNTCYPVIRIVPDKWWKGESFFADYKKNVFVIYLIN